MKRFFFQYITIAMGCGSASWGITLGPEIAKERCPWMSPLWQDVAGSVGGGLFGILFPVALPIFYGWEQEQEKKRRVERARWEKQKQEERETLNVIYREWGKETERIDSFIQSFEKK